MQTSTVVHNVKHTVVPARLRAVVKKKTTISAPGTELSVGNVFTYLFKGHEIIPVDGQKGPQGNASSKQQRLADMPRNPFLSFKTNILPNCSGISVCIDEWSNLQCFTALHHEPT
jgi:hypothetical protein